MGVAALAVACGGTGDEPQVAPSEGTEPTPTRVVELEGVSRPVVTGPIEGGRAAPHIAMPPELAAEHDYIEAEYLISGEATSYREAGEWGTDGRWEIEEDETAPFTTRLLVRRPASPDAFDGTVVVEWLNVSSGQDVDVVFGHGYDELLSSGSAWVGVSAQAKGVDGTGAIIDVPGVPAVPLTEWDPERYGDLVHPGDQFSYDLFSQAAAALLAPDGADPLDGLVPQRLIGVGESQGAARLVTYVNAVQPTLGLYDGFLIHSRGNGGSILAPDPAPQPPYAWIRDDLDVPVLQFETESDLFGIAFVQARQPDTERLRTWEVAGTAHLDASMVAYRAWAAGAVGADADAAGSAIEARCGRINEGPQSQVLRKALSSLRTWVATGEAPATSPQIEIADGDISRDELGIALGGIRTPPVDAPVVVLRGDNAGEGGYACALFGSTLPLDAAAIASRFPTQADFVEAVTRSARAAEEAGFLLPGDAEGFITEAEASTLGS